MCTSEDFAYGHGIDDELRRLYDMMPDDFGENPIALVAAVITLDEWLGLRQDGDYVLVTPGIMMWLIPMVMPTSPELKQALENMDMDLIEQLTVDRPFEVCFESPEGAEYSKQYPEVVRGKNVLLRMMSMTQAAELTFLYTVRADDTFIYRPGFKSRLAGNMQPRRLQDLSS